MCETATGLRTLGLFAGSARSSSVTAYGIDGSQGELSGLLVRSVSDLYKAGEQRVIFRIACVTPAIFTTKVGVSFVYHMNDDATV